MIDKYGVERRYYQVDLEPFPMDALPANLRDLTNAVAANIQVAPDLFAVPLLATLCIPLQSRFYVRVDSGYTEPLCLYVMAVARPSERKSAVISLLEKPLWEFQSEQSGKIQKENDEIPTWKRYSGAMKKPVTLYVTDATPEKLARLMEENNGAIALLSDEPDALSVAAGLRYGKGKNLGLMLQAWSAGRVMIQRATEDRRISIDRAVMSVAVMSQPSFVEDLVKDKEMSNRGFLQRFLFSRPLSKVGTRTFEKPDIPKVLLDEYDALVKELLSLDTDKLREISLNVNAKKVANQFFQVVEYEIRETPVLEGWMGKIFGQVIRLAGVLHCAQWGKDAGEHLIDSTTMCGAVKLGNYFISHAKAIFTDVDLSEEAEDSRELYRRMKEAKKEVFTKSDLYHVTGNHMPKARLELALAQLIKAQYVMIVDETADDKSRQYALLGELRELDEKEVYRY